MKPSVGDASVEEVEDPARNFPVPIAPKWKYAGDRENLPSQVRSIGGSS